MRPYNRKLYEEQLAEGDKYSTLSRTICINIINFKYLKNDRFQKWLFIKRKGYVSCLD
ncbi:PD-(D/E)XK nuclease family transposase [Tepidibacter sp. Z1-5]|uniref:PD-(D/E)XK nuclease family transposase n=1 Tax=Tepidibacter sp. Z1-5 TaxID=3134138 RepID=UPI0030C44019